MKATEIGWKILNEHKTQNQEGELTYVEPRG